MKITINLALFFTMAFLGLLACSKEKKIERSLKRSVGEWNVTNYHSIYHLYSEDTMVFETNTDNYATYRFMNNGDFQSSGEKGYNNYEGTWMNTEDELVIVGKDVNYYGSALVYKISEYSGDKMTLKRTEKGMDIDGFMKIETLKLERR